MDLSSEHVVLPQELFLELQTNAWNTPPMALTDRLAGTAQTIIIFAAFAGAGTAVIWAVARAQDWREERTLRRRMLVNAENAKPTTTS